MTNAADWPPISVVVITFNRFETLEPTVRCLLERLDYPCDLLELIISDDGSRPDVLAQIRKLPHDRLVESDGRKGLSANANRGLAAASHDLILQIQDDWELTPIGAQFRAAVRAISDTPGLGLFHLNTLPNDQMPHRVEQIAGLNLRLFDNRPDRPVARVGQHPYSDWPHLKTRDFVQAIGPYDEALPMWDAELDYSQRVNAQTEFVIGDCPDLTAFDHIGAELSYNKGSLLSRIKGALLKLPGMPALRDLRNRLTGRGK